MSSAVRALFLADSHLGFDLPLRPRVERRRRGHDFLANYAAALQPAFDGEVDFVVHGGDVFDQSHIPATLAYQAFEPLVRIAERGVPVFIVPGNHERSVLPHIRFARHALIHIFDRPRTFTLDVRGTRVALAGFPYERKHVRTRFPQLLQETGYQQAAAHARLLCIHHCVEGATVGPGNYTFTSAADVIRCADLPRDFTAVLSGHIHRQQVLTRDLRRRPINAPVLYPGSIERTSIAEIGECKGFMMLRLRADAPAQWEFRPLYARPMFVHELSCDEDVEATLCRMIDTAPPDAVLRIKLRGEWTETARRVLSAANLRSLAPATMNIELSSRAFFDTPH